MRDLPVDTTISAFTEPDDSEGGALIALLGGWSCDSAGLDDGVDVDDCSLLGPHCRGPYPKPCIGSK